MGVSAKPEKLYSLQAYRGIAALLVVLHHASKLAQAKFGYTFLGDSFVFGYSGVDFFFVLSGFIILEMHHQDLGQPARWGAYALKRFIRVFPIYWLVTLVIIPVFFVNPRLGGGYERDLGVIIKSLLLIPQNHFPILVVSWTLSHEMWFYLLFSLAILAPRRLTHWCALVLVAASLVGWILTLIKVRDPSPITYAYGFALSGYNLEFALGCLASHLLRQHRVRRPNLLLLAGGVLFVTAAVFDASLLARLGNAHRILSYGLPSFLIVLGSVAREREGRLAVPRFLAYLGDASYSLYLIHALVLSLAAKVAIKLGALGCVGPGATVVLMILVATAAGCVCYSIVERPLLAATRRALLPRAA